MNNKWDELDNDPNYDPNEIHKDQYKNFTYEELFQMSKPATDQEKQKCNNYKKISISSFDNYEQIFHDIAHSKKAKRMYLKSTIISIIFCLIQLLPIFYFVFSSYGLIVSKFTFFLVKIEYWKIIIIPSIFSLMFDYFLEKKFINYLPIDTTGKMDFSYRGNKTSHTKAVVSAFTSSAWLKYVKPKIKQRYIKYKAENNKEYLFDKEMEGRYYSIRNWYLIAKYITLGKMKISDLEPHFEDELFVYLTKNNYKKESLKLRIIFNKKFSLYFMCNFMNLVRLVYTIIIPIFACILCLSIW